MKKFILAFLLAAGYTFVAPVAPANAGFACEVLHQCGDFYHAPDAGFDGSIPVTCNLSDPWDNYRQVAERQSSTCHDSDAFYVGYGRTVSCLYGGEVWVKYSRVGWHKFNDTENLRCVHGLP